MPISTISYLAGTRHSFPSAAYEHTPQADVDVVPVAMTKTDTQRLTPSTLQAVLDQIAAGINDTQICRKTGVQRLVFRELRRMKWSRKVATKRAAEQSEALRRVFQARVQQNYVAEQLVAINESACNERTGDRKYGWGLIGCAVELEYSIRQSEQWSLLPAMTVDGYLAHRIFQGAITAELMVEFLQEDVLPRCTPGYHVLLIDNASIYRSPAITAGYGTGTVDTWALTIETELIDSVVVANAATR
ncbi:hypothetical protein OPT61_g4115 [Boeremia exigua]|uniref:Uncharacterized protein n=1 Tax=Boeremia exigua TaxID=749465 RepID=A0ACC2IFD4_9PLEO|nr:hypothetical protein OPT61_g4115 [Boeremia exigua]